MKALPPELTTLYPFEHRYFQCGKETMHYLDEGQGPAVVMLHGNPTWSFYFRNVVSLLRNRFRCIVPDHIGFGLSDKPQEYPYTLDQHIQNLSLLLEHLNIEQTALIVHDWGGAIGAGWAVQHPGALRAWAVMNTAAFRSARIPWRINILRTPLIGEWIIRAYNGFARPALNMAACCELNPNVCRGLLFPYDNWANRVGIAAFVKDIPMSSRHRSFQRLREIEEGLPRLASVPMLLAWGMRDFCFDASFLEEWQRRFPEARTVSFPRAGHYVLEDAETEILPVIDQFLSENLSSESAETEH